MSQGGSNSILGGVTSSLVGTPASPGGAPAFPGKLQPLWEVPASLGQQEHHPQGCNSIPLGYQHPQGGNRMVGRGGYQHPQGNRTIFGGYQHVKDRAPQSLGGSSTLGGELATAAASAPRNRTGVPPKHPADARAPVGAGTHPAGSRRG